VTVRNHERIIPDLEGSVHDTILMLCTFDTFGHTLGTILETHEHLGLGIENFGVEFQSLLGISMKKLIWLK